MKSSFSPRAWTRGRAAPGLRDTWLHSTMRVTMRGASGTGERNTQGSMRNACFITCGEVWMSMAAKVPTTTIISAAEGNQRLQAGALQDRTGEQRDEGQNDTNDAQQIHGLTSPLALPETQGANAGATSA